MKNLNWKYVWRWNEPFVNCGGQGANSAKYFIKELQKKGFDCKIKTEHSGYVGHVYIEIYCKDFKTKKAIQFELWNNQYTDTKTEKWSWELVKEK